MPPMVRYGYFLESPSDIGEVQGAVKCLNAVFLSVLSYITQQWTRSKTGISFVKITMKELVQSQSCDVEYWSEL